MRIIPKMISNMFTDTRANAGMVPVAQQTGYGSMKPDLYNDQAFIATVGYLTSLPDPDITLRNAGITRKDLKQLESDDEIYGALDTRRDACIATPYRFEGTEGPQLDFVIAEIEKHLRTIMSTAWRAVPYGYSVAECVYEQRGDGSIGIAKYEEKPLEWFRPNVDNSLILFSPFQGQEVVDTKYKFFMTRRQATYINPYGEALLSRLWWPHFFRSNTYRFWLRFLDRHGDPMLLAKAGKPKDLVEALTTMGIENVVAVGKDEAIEVVMNHGTDVFERFDAVISGRIQKLILGQTLTSDNAKGGSNALGQVHNEVRMDKRNSDLVLVTDTVQRVINAIVELNFGLNAEKPVFVMEDELGIEAARAERDATLAKAGILKFTASYIERVYDLEPTDFEVPTFDAQVQLAKVNPVTGDPTEPPANPATPVKKESKKTKFAAETERFTKDQLEVEAIGDEAISAATLPIDVADIRAVIFAARDAADLKDRLAVLLQDADPAAFATTLERAMIAADVLGYVHARA